MLYKISPNLCTSMYLLLRSQAHKGMPKGFSLRQLHHNFNSHNKMNKQNNTSNAADVTQTAISKNISPKIKTKEHKTRRLDMRLTPELDDKLVAEATERGITKTAYVEMILEGRRPLPPMTDKQMAAVMQISAARADLIHISNALQKKSQQERKALFGSITFMKAWIDGVNTLIRQLDRIIHLFVE